MNLQAVFDLALPQTCRLNWMATASDAPDPKLRALSAGLMAVGLLVFPFPGFSQTPNSLAAARAPASAKLAASGPSWAELTPAQQRALAPLALSWNTGMSEDQKHKWLEISRNYSARSPEGQASLNSRMNDWASLSPQQRAQARLNFGKTKELSKQLTAEEKKAKWEAYQALSPEEKQKLAAKSPRPTGAATAIKPVAPQKLITLPPQVGIKPASKIMPSPPATVTTPASQAATVDTGPAPLR